MTRHLLLLCLLGVLPLGAFSQKTIKKCFRLPPLLDEVSGLYLADNQSFWWHNDGGGRPALYKTNGSGKLVDSMIIHSIRNKDWEDVTVDDSGNIYIGDFGNNQNRRKDLCIYIYNPHTRILDSILYHYPDQSAFPPPLAERNFDMEAFFWYNHQLHLFSKNIIGKGNYYCKHYVLNDQPGVQSALLKDSIHLKNRVVTAAAISPDGRTVALLAYNYKKLLGIFPFSAASVFLITDFEVNNFLAGKLRKKRAPSFLIATQFESLDFLTPDTIYIASEKTVFIKPKAKRVKLKPLIPKEHPY